MTRGLRVRGRIAVLPAAVCVITALAGCGGDSPRDVVDQTAGNLAKVRSGRLDLNVAIRPLQGGGNGVGVKLRGPFALARPGKLPTARIDYTQTAGASATTATLVSVPDQAFVRVRGTDYRLPEAETAQLRSSAGGGVSLAQLHVADWIEKPRLEAAGGGVQRVSGSLDLAAALRDVTSAQRKASGAGGLSEREVRQLRSAVRSSSIELLTGSDDHLLRRIRATASLALPPELRRAAGGPGVRLIFELRLSAVNRAVSVQAPVGAQPLPSR